jgi:hypothetical protein
MERDVVLVGRCSDFCTRNCFGGDARGSVWEGTHGGDKQGSARRAAPRAVGLSNRTTNKLTNRDFANRSVPAGDKTGRKPYSAAGCAVPGAAVVRWLCRGGAAAAGVCSGSG